MTNLDKLCLELLIICEGRRYTTYFDSGFWNIGIGLKRVYPDGSYIKKDDTCTDAQMDGWCLEYLQKHVYPLLTEWKLPDRLYAGLASFAYNEGHIWDDMKAILNVSPLNLDNLCSAFLKHNLSAGKPILTSRRQKEINFMKGN